MKLRKKLRKAVQVFAHSPAGLSECGLQDRRNRIINDPLCNKLPSG